jgi:surface antigen
MTLVRTSVAFLAALALVVTGCAQWERMGRKEQTGTAVGAGAGAVVGGAIGEGTGGTLLGAAIGGVAGALVGREIGRYLDDRDQREMQQSAQNALETDERVAWQNPETGNQGTITPTRSFEGPEGRLCREYVQTVFIEGQEQQVHGTACRQADGTWQVVSAPPPPGTPPPVR